MSVSFDLDLGEQIRYAAAQEQVSVSAWLAEAARDRLRNEGLAGAIKMWEEEFGPIPDEAKARADRLFDEAAKLRRRKDDA